MAEERKKRGHFDFIPVKVAKAIGERFGYDQVLIVARKTGKGGGERVVTWGRNKAHCDVALRIADFLVEKWKQLREEKGSGHLAFCSFCSGVLGVCGGFHAGSLNLVLAGCLAASVFLFWLLWGEEGDG